MKQHFSRPWRSGNEKKSDISERWKQSLIIAQLTKLKRFSRLWYMQGARNKVKNGRLPEFRVCYLKSKETQAARVNRMEYWKGKNYTERTLQICRSPFWGFSWVLDSTYTWGNFLSWIRENSICVCRVRNSACFHKPHWEISRFMRHSVEYAEEFPHSSEK